MFLSAAAIHGNPSPEPDIDAKIYSIAFLTDTMNKDTIFVAYGT